MARIEGGEKRDAGRVREWLARAVRAPRDALWIADGVASEEWAPISPVTGKLDAFEWRVPADKPKSVGSDNFFEEISSLGGDFEGVVRVAPSSNDDETTKNTNETKASTAQALTLDLTVRDSATKKATQAPVAKASLQSQTSRSSVAASEPETQSAQQTTAGKPAGAVASKDSVALSSSTAGSTDVTVSDSTPAKLAPAASGSEASHPAVKSTTATAAAKAPRKIETRIFVPDRPPDDPGPGLSDSEMDDASTPVTRFRTALKQP
jgi:HemY protein